MDNRTFFPERSPEVEIKFKDEFGSETRFSSTMTMFTTAENQVEVFIRFLLACGYSMVSIARALESGLNYAKEELSLGASYDQEDLE